MTDQGMGAWATVLREAISPDPCRRRQSVRQLVRWLAGQLPSGVEVLAVVRRGLR